MGGDNQQRVIQKPSGRSAQSGQRSRCYPVAHDGHQPRCSSQGQDIRDGLDRDDNWLACACSHSRSPVRWAHAHGDRSGSARLRLTCHSEWTPCKARGILARRRAARSASLLLHRQPRSRGGAPIPRPAWRRPRQSSTVQTSASTSLVKIPAVLPRDRRQRDEDATEHDLLPGIVGHDDLRIRWVEREYRGGLLTAWCQQ